MNKWRRDEFYYMGCQFIKDGRSKNYKLKLSDKEFLRETLYL